MKKCPFCAEEILDEAIKCKHCGSNLSTGGTQTRKRRTHPLPLVMLTLIVLFVIAFIASQGGPAAPGIEPASVDAATSARMEKLLADSQQAGLIHRIDDYLSHVYVNPRMWAMLDIDSKRGFAVACAHHFKLRGNRGYAHVYDSMTGKRIASMSSVGTFSVQ